MRRIILIGLATLGLLAGCTTAPTLTDIPAALASAKTPEDHQRLAAFFEDKAKSYDAEAVQHDRWADQYLAGAGTGGAPTAARRWQRTVASCVISSASRPSRRACWPAPIVRLRARPGECRSKLTKTTSSGNGYVSRLTPHCCCDE